MDTIVPCVVCGVEFDLYEAPWCDGHVEARRDHEDVSEGLCKVCPNGHALHDMQGWEELPWRPATADEQRLGFAWMVDMAKVGEVA